VTEEQKYLDQLYQSRFANFEAEPPARVWDNVHGALHGKGGGSFNPVNLALLAALVLISGLLGFSIIKDSPSRQHENLVADGQTAMLLESELPALPSTAISTADKQHVPSTETTTAGSKSFNKTAQKGKSADVIPQGKSGNNNSQAVSSGSNANQSSGSQLFLGGLKSRRPMALQRQSGITEVDGIRVRDSRYHPRFSGINDGERRYNRRASWQAGVFFTPEVVFYPDDSIRNQRGYTFDISARWQKKEFFVESGLGISFSSDDGRYAIDYEKFLGTYDDVYEVTFDTAENGAIVPIYHTNVVNVYDSISRYRIQTTKNRYTYLQVPVYIGFHKQVNRFGWFIKGGPIFSVLLNSNVPDPETGSDRIVDLDQQMSPRVSTHWQMAFSAGVSYQLSSKVSIAVEPTFRYYLNSQYERKYITTRHPYSFGLRTGLLFNF